MDLYVRCYPKSYNGKSVICSKCMIHLKWFNSLLEVNRYVWVHLYVSRHSYKGGHISWTFACLPNIVKCSCKKKTERLMDWWVYLYMPFCQSTKHNTFSWLFPSNIRLIKVALCSTISAKSLTQVTKTFVSGCLLFTSTYYYCPVRILWQWRHCLFTILEYAYYSRQGCKVSI